ncbi:ArdC family protein [Acidiphilium iwatense]|uniref:SsDNA-binding domain-containing protein n=1 Tax=Acidiphilium iwatense TaxID=768198 RepID=A0ABS9DZT4_9PROT|nr:zincin-like metallopeptidase domain-containing protein [Acidiphilium iwatense]MCF3948274.1 ssDNA-binding domain-containing protein [Acidiphilium iwatense]
MRGIRTATRLTVANDYAQTVAASIVRQLEQGTAPWVKPWEPSGHRFIPYNAVTGKDYQGGNAVWLMVTAEDKRYGDARWMTYKQAQSVDAQVMRGERGTLIQYIKKFDREPVHDEQGRLVKDAEGKLVYRVVELDRPRVFSAVVFNADQVSGLPKIEARPTMPEWERHQAAERIMDNAGVQITYKPGDRAYYVVSEDRITMPERAQFKMPDGFYATSLHELGHATGHPSRLNRPDLGAPFGSESYAREELRAEIASLMMADRLGIGHDPSQHAAYVGNWIKALQQEPREIFRAASDAEKIAGYLTTLQHQKAVQGTAADARQADAPERGYWQKAIESGRQIQAKEAAARPEAERQAHEGRRAGASR